MQLGVWVIHSREVQYFDHAYTPQPNRQTHVSHPDQTCAVGHHFSFSCCWIFTSHLLLFCALCLTNRHAADSAKHKTEAHVRVNMYDRDVLISLAESLVEYQPCWWRAAINDFPWLHAWWVSPNLMVCRFTSASSLFHLLCTSSSAVQTDWFPWTAI